MPVMTRCAFRPPMSALLAYPWPGNIRELRNVLQYALATCEEDEITVQDLPDECLPRVLARCRDEAVGPASEYEPARALRELLRRENWNVSAIAFMVKSSACPKNARTPWRQRPQASESLSLGLFSARIITGKLPRYTPRACPALCGPLQ